MNIIMPKMGESIMEGTIIKWHKRPGDDVKKDEVLFEIATDKVDAEVPSPESGVLLCILTDEQQTVPVGTVVAELDTKNEALTQSNPADTSIQTNYPAETTPIEFNDKTFSFQDELSETAPDDRFFSPLVINIAKKERIMQSELASIKGTGLGGRVTKKDILAYVEKKNRLIDSNTSPSSPASINKMPPITVFSEDKIERLPMDHIRQRIMQHMVNSRDTSVHVTEMLEVDMTRVHNYLMTHKDSILKSDGIKISYLSFIAYAVTRALREHPLLNSAISGNEIIKKKFVNLGIAVAIEPDGLIVPNIKDAQEKNFLGLASKINETVDRARKKKLTPDEISGGTFTITNYGVFGTLFGTPIINQPEVAILGAGAVNKKPVVVEINGLDTIAIKPMMYLSLSHDHRLIDGMAGGRFLQTVKTLLENFNEM